MGEPHRPADRSEHGEPGFRDGTMHPLHRLHVAVGCEPNAASKTDDYRPFSPWGHGSALHGICPPRRRYGRASATVSPCHIGWRPAHVASPMIPG